MGRGRVPAEAIELSEADRRELEGLARRRGSLRWRPREWRTRGLLPAWVRTPLRWARGAAGLPNGVSTDCMTSLALVRRGVHRSTQDIAAAILDYIDTVNADPKPCRWTKSADNMSCRHQSLLPQSEFPRFGSNQLPPQPVDATQALNLSAGVSNPKVLRGRSLS